MSDIDISIDDIEFSVRTANAFRAVGILTIGAILNFRDEELLRIPNFGRKSLNETREVLISLGYKMKGSTRGLTRHVDAFISETSYRKLIALAERNNEGSRTLLGKIIEASLADTPSYDDIAARLERLERTVSTLVVQK